MSRLLFEQIALFLAPFIVFSVYLVLRRRNPFTLAPWDGKSLWLAVAGMGLVVALMLFSALTQPRSSGAYVPPHMEDGQLRPGGFK